uniref:Sugar kinase n=1 Tax=Panagrellus redivivus TaxID=6233 RepID=A0A7E4UZX7_PANRE
MPTALVQIGGSLYRHRFLEHWTRQATSLSIETIGVGIIYPGDSQLSLSKNATREHDPICTRHQRHCLGSTGAYIGVIPRSTGLGSYRATGLSSARRRNTSNWALCLQQTSPRPRREAWRP